MRVPGINPRDWSAELQFGAWLLIAVLAVGCRTAPPLPPADFSAPGWRVQQGQAVWKPTRSRPELAGELLLATNVSGVFFVQFSKPPFSLATAQIRNGQWQIEFGNGERRWTGRGEPPSRFAWFQLPGAIAGEVPKANWRFTHLTPETGAWKI